MIIPEEFYLRKYHTTGENFLIARKEKKAMSINLEQICYLVKDHIKYSKQWLAKILVGTFKVPNIS